MKRFLIPIISILTALAASADAKAADQTLYYDVSYHCGFIKITAGEAAVDFNTDGENFTASLNGQTESIEGHIFAISDTLQTRMDRAEGISKETVTYENGWYTRVKTKDVDGSALDFTNPATYKNIWGGGDLNASSETMEAVTITADMLAMFYYFQELDFENMQPGQNINMAVTLPDNDVQQVNIIYEGSDTYKGLPTYKVKFTYSYHGEMSAYPVTAQIHTVTRLPLLFSADIKIGHVELTLRA